MAKVKFFYRFGNEIETHNLAESVAKNCYVRLDVKPEQWGGTTYYTLSAELNRKDATAVARFCSGYGEGFRAAQKLDGV